MTKFATCENGDGLRKTLMEYSWLLSTLRELMGAFALEISTPSIIFGDAKGAFSIRFHGQPAHLARSNVLHLLATATVLGTCYSVQRVFRDEAAFSNCHLSEFDLLDCVLIGVPISKSMDIVEQLIREIHDKAIVQFGAESVAPLTNISFCRMPWQEAEKHFAMASQGDLSHGIKSEEPVFLTNIPRAYVSWALKDTQDGNNKSAFNLMLPGVGEVVEGGERDLNRKKLLTKLCLIGRLQQLKWYADAIGCMNEPVTSFGLGVERLAMWLFNMPDITKITMFWRKACFSEIPFPE